MGSLLKIGIPQMAREGVKNSNFLDCPEAKRGGADGVSAATASAMSALGQ
jgi:hypothetical protein